MLIFSKVPPDLNAGRHNTFSYKTSTKKKSQSLNQMEADYLMEHNAESATEDPTPQHSQVTANMYLNGASLEDICIAFEKLKNPKPSIDPKTKLPLYVHKWFNVFSHTSANKLPPHQDWDYKINLQPGKKPPFGPLYNMSVEEVQVLKLWLKENLDKESICKSSSQAVSPVFFVKKPNSSLCM